MSAALILPLSPAHAEDSSLNIVWMGWPEAHVTPNMDAFKNAHPDVEVNHERIPFNQIFQTLGVRLSAKTADPDVYIVDSPLTASYAVRGDLLDLTGLVDKDRFTPAAIAAATFNGKIYSAPIASSSTLLFYNKDLLKAAGVEAPSGDPDKRLTWAQTVAAATFRPRYAIP